MTSQADLVMSILVPAEAVGVARVVAEAMGAAGVSRPVRGLQCGVSQIGIRYGVHHQRGRRRLYRRRNHRRLAGQGSGASNLYFRPCAGLMDELDGGHYCQDLGPSIGRASGIKMCYASMTKGTNALRVAMLTAAESLGLYDELIEELAFSQGGALSAMESGIPGLPANSGRWIGEMEEIAETSTRWE